MKIEVVHVLLAAGAVVAWAAAHLLLPFLLGAVVVRRWPRLARFLPHSPTDEGRTRPPNRPRHRLRSPEPDADGMRARYDEAIYAQLEGRLLTPAQQRIVQIHYHGEGCHACQAGR